MPTRQEHEERKRREIERVANRARKPADRLFGGNLARGFLYWATDLHLDQTINRPTEDDLLSSITDGKDDLELDAYHVDEDARTVYLFQSKFRSNPGNLLMRDLANFHDVPGKLATPRLLAGLSNQGILEFAPTFRQRIVDGYELKLVYFTTYTVSKKLLDRAQKWSEDPLQLEIGGDYIEVAHSAMIVGLDELIRIIDSLSTVKEIELTLRLSPSDFHESNSGNFRCLIATLRLEELAKTFDVHRFAIFRFNPRGPLGSVAVNKDISNTLKDPEKRKLFQLMNNGLSAVCTAFKVVGSGEMAKVNIRDFQIVNGCQTTYNVYDYWRRAGELDDAKVTLKLIEDPSLQLRRSISAASNKQSQMKDWDFLFDEPEQQRLQREFAELTPPIFYELRRGESKYIESGVWSERVTIKDAAQAMWAFVGKPGEAKDRLREIPRSTGQGASYREVFYPGVEAERLWLPLLLYERVQEAWRIHYEKDGERGDHREHGRLHILWLIGRSVGCSYKVPEYRKLPIVDVRRLVATLDEWFQSHHRIAIEALEFVVEVKYSAAMENGRTLSLRQLFRSADNYSDFAKRHDKVIEENLQELRNNL